MSRKDLQYNQRVVCAALRKMTQDTQLIRSGFVYWNQSLASLEFNVEDVTAELSKYLGIGVGEKKTLMLTMHAARNKVFDELPPVPDMLLKMVSGDDAVAPDLSGAIQSSDGDSVSAIPAHCVVTVNFLSTLASYTRRHDKDSIAELKKDIMGDVIEGLRDKVGRAAKQWASGGFEKIVLPDDIKESECYDLTHGIYMIMVDVIGPMEADKVVDIAMAEANKLDESSRFNPSKLL